MVLACYRACWFIEYLLEFGGVYNCLCLVFVVYLTALRFP